MANRATQKLAFTALLDSVDGLPRGKGILPTPVVAGSPDAKDELIRRLTERKNKLENAISSVYMAYTDFCRTDARRDILDWFNE